MELMCFLRRDIDGGGRIQNYFYLIDNTYISKLGDIHRPWSLSPKNFGVGAVQEEMSKHFIFHLTYRIELLVIHEGDTSAEKISGRKDVVYYSQREVLWALLSL